MSADNMIVVRKVSGEHRFGVSMEFASDDWDCIIPMGSNDKGIKYFDSHEEAIAYAYDWEAQESIVEYGVVNCVWEHAWSYGTNIRTCDYCGVREAYWDDEAYGKDYCDGETIPRAYS